MSFSCLFDVFLMSKPATKQRLARLRNVARNTLADATRKEFILERMAELGTYDASKTFELFVGGF